MAKGRGLKICGGVTIGLGLAATIIGAIFPLIISSATETGINDTLVVDSADHDDYDDFLTNNSDDPSSIAYYAISVYNITNADALAAGTATQIESTETGVYWFRYYSTKYNVSFPQDGNEVHYNEYTTFQFDAARTASENPGLELSQDDIVTVPSLAYLGAMGSLQSEANARIALGAGVLASQLEAASSVLTAAGADISPAGVFVAEGPPVLTADSGNPDHDQSYYTQVDELAALVPFQNTYVNIFDYSRDSGSNTYSTMTEDQANYLLFNEAVGITLTGASGVPNSLFFASLALSCVSGDCTNFAAYAPAFAQTDGQINAQGRGQAAAVLLFLSEGIGGEQAQGGIALQGVFLQNGGSLFVKKAVHQLVLDSLDGETITEDALLSTLGFTGRAASTGFLCNVAKEPSAGETGANDPCGIGIAGQRTGKANIEEVSKYTMYRSMEVFPAYGGELCGTQCTPDTNEGIYAEDKSVGGFASTQFPPAKADGFNLKPRLDKDTQYSVWSTSLQRELPFDFGMESSYKGLDTYRYYLSHDLNEVDTSYFYNVAGVANLTTVTGSPVVGLTHNMVALSAEERAYILQGQQFTTGDCVSTDFSCATVETRDQDPELYDSLQTFFDIVPEFGATIYGHERLTVAAIFPGVVDGAYAGNLPELDPNGMPAFVIPYLKVDRNAEVADSSASDLRDIITLNNETSTGVQIGVTIGGVVLFFVGIGLVMAGKKQSKKQELEADDESYMEAEDDKKANKSQEEDNGYVV
eukprot:Clim_evm16s6 gene=Clim_evmTU16s6